MQICLEVGSGRSKLNTYITVVEVNGLECGLAEQRVKCSNPAKYFEKLVAKLPSHYGNFGN
jgi:hypothetical protein